MKPFHLSAVAGAAALLSLQLSAQVSYTAAGAVYSQDFDSLAASGTGNAWVNDTTLPGWSLFRVTSNSDPTPADITTYNAGTGSLNSGAFYSYGSSGSAERALGGLGSGAAYFGGGSTSGTTLSNGGVAGWIALAVENATGQSIGGFTLHFDGEQWRDGGAATPAAQPMGFEYGFGSTMTAVPEWMQPGAAFEFVSPVAANTGSGSAVDGNGAGRAASLGGAVEGVDWAAGETLWLRWVERNDAGSDHGLAIDNLSFAAVPEPSEYATAAATLLALTLVFRRRKGAGEQG
jgi:hypothetical protein